MVNELSKMNYSAERTVDRKEIKDKMNLIEETI